MLSAVSEVDQWYELNPLGAESFTESPEQNVAEPSTAIVGADGAGTTTISISSVFDKPYVSVTSTV